MAEENDDRIDLTQVRGYADIATAAERAHREVAALQASGIPVSPQHEAEILAHHVHELES